MVLTLVLDRGYLVPFGLMKCIEFFTLLIGWSTWANWTSGWVWYTPSKVEYFLAVSIIAWLFVMIWFLLNIFKITNKIQVSPKNVVFAIPHFILGVLVGIGALLMAIYCEGACGWSSLTTGWVFGFISAGVLIFDGILHIVMGKELYGGVTVTTTVVTTTA